MEQAEMDEVRGAMDGDYQDEVLGEAINEMRRVLHWSRLINRTTVLWPMRGELVLLKPINSSDGDSWLLPCLPEDRITIWQSYVMHVNHGRALIAQLLRILDLYGFDGRRSRALRSVPPQRLLDDPLKYAWSLMLDVLRSTGVELPDCLREGTVNAKDFRRVTVHVSGATSHSSFVGLSTSWASRSDHDRPDFRNLEIGVERAVMLLQDVAPKVPWEERTHQLAVVTVILSTLQLVLSAAVAICTVDFNGDQKPEGDVPGQTTEETWEGSEKFFVRCSGLLDQLDSSSRLPIEFVVKDDSAEVFSTNDPGRRVVDRVHKNQCVDASRGRDGWLKIKYRNRVEDRDVEGWVRHESLMRR